MRRARIPRIKLSFCSLSAIAPQASLQDFALKHRQDIRRDPVFRCARRGPPCCQLIPKMELR